jgi:hypothetical protein
MPSTAVDIGAFLLLVLPGFLVYGFATDRRADPATHSPLWQLAEILQYSVYVHLLGIGLVFGIAWVIGRFGIHLHLDQLPRLSPTAFLSTYFLEGVLLFTLYPVYVVVAATIMGAYDAPSWTTANIVRATSGAARSIAHIPLLHWVKPPPPPFPREPIWHETFATLNGSGGPVRVLVKMKLGDIYDGYIITYPILPDYQQSKDFLLTRASYFPKGDLTNEYRLEEIPGGGLVLLNASDVDSIQVYYEGRQ